jgi:hypothetical protein
MAAAWHAGCAETVVAAVAAACGPDSRERDGACLVVENSSFRRFSFSVFLNQLYASIRVSVLAVSAVAVNRLKRQAPL